MNNTTNTTSVSAPAAFLSLDVHDVGELVKSRMSSHVFPRTQRRVSLVDDQGKFVADLRICNRYQSVASNPVEVANGKEIVRRYNSYEALLAALHNCSAALSYAIAQMGDDPLARKLEATLTAARETSAKAKA